MTYYYQQNQTRRDARCSRRNADINMTNLMDVMMVLLVVFLVAAPLMTSGIALDLPKVGGPELEGEDISINVSVDKDGYYYIGQTEVSAEEIVGKLNAIRAQNSMVTVTISGDTGTEYGRVIGLMALLKEAGFDKVGLRTEPRPLQSRKK